MRRTAQLLPLLFLGRSVAQRAAPVCTAPPGIVAVIPEALCYTEVAPTNPSGVSIVRRGGFATRARSLCALFSRTRPPPPPLNVDAAPIQHHKKRYVHLRPRPRRVPEWRAVCDCVRS